MIDEPITGSSIIKRIQHDGKDAIVTFKNGSRYKYLNVPDRTMQEWLASWSIGVFFSSQIKKNYTAEQL